MCDSAPTPPQSSVISSSLVSFRDYLVTTVNDPRAVLTGAVGYETAKAKAEHLVKDVRGVKSVDNKIVVSG